MCELCKGNGKVDLQLNTKIPWYRSRAAWIRVLRRFQMIALGVIAGGALGMLLTWILAR